MLYTFGHRTVTAAQAKLLLTQAADTLAKSSVDVTDDTVVTVGGTSFPSIYEAMRAGGVEMDNHETDLYVPVTPYTLAVVKGYRFAGNVTTFTHQIRKTQWFDIPFAYLPAWDRKPNMERLRAAVMAENVGSAAQVPTFDHLTAIRVPHD